MRVLAWILVLATVLVGAFFGYCYYGAQMQIEGVAAAMTPAVDALATYNELTEQIAQGTFYGGKYRDAEFIMPDGYAFLTLTVRMSNQGFLSQDWIRIEVVPDPADIVQLPESRTPTLAARTRADFSATVLTQLGASTSRKIIIHYYVLGREFSIEHQM